MHALVYLAGFWYEYYNSAKQQDSAIGYKIGRGLGPHCQKSSFKIKILYYCGVLLVLNHCSNHREIPSAVLILLEKTDFVIHVIDF